MNIKKLFGLAEKEQKKIRVGIDINEILRAKWLQFDKFYYQEFDGIGIPESNPYSYDLFKTYLWEDTVVTEKVLKEDAPETINPLDYVVDEETGEAPADFLLFNTIETSRSARENFNRFMYEDYLLEIFGTAPAMYKNMEKDIETFYTKYSNYVEFIVISKENWCSIAPTLYFLSKTKSRFKNYKFVNDSKEMLDSVDVLITTDPEILEMKDIKNKKIIKLNRPYNDTLMSNETLAVLHLKELIENKAFEKIIKFK